jgi:hypothetical protein
LLFDLFREGVLMPETVTVLEDQGIIEVRSFGEVSADDWQKSVDVVMELVRYRGLTKILVDSLDLVSLPKTWTLYEFGNLLASINFPPSVRIAATIQGPLRDDLKFVETVATNRGRQLKVFGSIDEAIAWLNE